MKHVLTRRGSAPPVVVLVILSSGRMENIRILAVMEGLKEFSQAKEHLKRCVPVRRHHLEQWW